MSDLSLIASRLPGAPGAISAQAITATVPDPPRNFASLESGTILRGTVQGRDKDGLITITTDRGQIRIATNANLQPGANVTLEVRSVGDRLQVVLLAIDQPPLPASPAGTQAGPPSQGPAGAGIADGHLEAGATGSANDPSLRAGAQISSDKAEPAPTVVVAGTRLTAIVIQAVPRDLLRNPATGIPQSGPTTPQTAINAAPASTAAAPKPGGASTFSADFLETQPPPISASLLPDIHDRITALFSQPLGDVSTDLQALPSQMGGFVLAPEVRDRIIALFVGPAAGDEPPATPGNAAAPSPPAAPPAPTPLDPATANRPATPGQTSPLPDRGITQTAGPTAMSPSPAPAPQGNPPPPVPAQTPAASSGSVPLPAGSQGINPPTPQASSTAAAPAPTPVDTAPRLSDTTLPGNPPSPTPVPNVATGTAPIPDITVPAATNTAPVTTTDPRAATPPQPAAPPLTSSASGVASNLQTPSIAASIPPPISMNQAGTPPPVPATSQPPIVIPGAAAGATPGQPVAQQPAPPSQSGASEIPQMPLPGPGQPNPVPPGQPTGAVSGTDPRSLPPQPDNQASPNQSTRQPQPQSQSSAPPPTPAGGASPIPGDPRVSPTAPTPTAPTQVSTQSSQASPAAPVAPPVPAAPPAQPPATIIAGASTNIALANGGQLAVAQPAAPQATQQTTTPLPGAKTQTPVPGSIPGNAPDNPGVTPGTSQNGPGTAPPQIQPRPLPASGNPAITIPTAAPPPSINGLPGTRQISPELLAQLVADAPPLSTNGQPVLPAPTGLGTGSILPTLTGSNIDNLHPTIGQGAWPPSAIGTGTAIPGPSTPGQVTTGPIIPGVAAPLPTLPGAVLPSPSAPAANTSPLASSIPAVTALQDPAVSPSPIPPLGITPLVTNLAPGTGGDAGAAAVAKAGATPAPIGAKATETPATATAATAENKPGGIAVTAIVSSLGKPGATAPAIAAGNAEYQATNLAVSGASEDGLAKLDLAGKEQLSTPLPTGTEVRLRVINIQTQPSMGLSGTGPTGVGLAGTAMPTPGVLAWGKGGTILGQILGHTPAGHPVIHTAIGDLVLQQQASLPVGGEITLALEAVEMAATGSQALAATPQMTAINLAQGWPTLLDLLVTLQKGLAAGTEAGGTAPDASDPANLARLPQTGSKLAAGLNAAVDAFRSGDFEKLFGPLTSALKSTGGKQEAIRKLRDEFGQLSMLAQDRPNQDWKCFMLPVWDDGRLQQINLFYRRPRRNQGGKDKKDDATRFVVDVNFTRLGGCQLDGLIRKKNFDLMVRSHQELPLSIKRDIAGLFAQARDIGNYAGEVSFQTAMRFPVSPLDDIAEGPPSVTA